MLSLLLQPRLLLLSISLPLLFTCMDSHSAMSSRRSERARKRPLSIDTQHATPSLTSLATTSFQKPTETDFRETAFDRLAGEENGVNGLTEVSLETLGRSVGRTKGGSVRSSAGKRTRTAAALSGITRNKENGGDTIQQHEQDSEVVLHHQLQQVVNGAQSFVGDEQDHAELQEESEKEDEEEEDEEDPVWQEFSQEYYEGMFMHALTSCMDELYGT